MRPTYAPGDTLLAATWLRPKVGVVVVVTHNQRPLIKRVTKLTSDRIWVEGDNRDASTDSRQFGSLPRSQIRARILLKL
jgi:phage repressor protein C with HTH and peptisase S24 domain